MTLQQELHIYKLMWHWYRLPSWWLCILQLTTRYDYTSGGFCYMLANAPFICSYNYQLRELNTLWKLKPGRSQDSVLNSAYWFKPGHVKPRRELLRKAIKLVKAKLVQTGFGEGQV